MQAATVVINRRALRHNLQRLRELAPASKLVAVVKANAYGHGLLETARTLPDADAFGVARLEEALRLRAGGITQPILLLEGFLMPPICRLFPRSVCIQPSITEQLEAPKPLIWLNPLPSDEARHRYAPLGRTP